MIGKGQDKKINKDGSGMTHREMNWFKSCGRGLNGQFPQSVLVDTKEMKISTGHQLDEFSSMPLRAMIFAMDSIVKNQLKNRIEDVAETMGNVVVTIVMVVDYVKSMKTSKMMITGSFVQIVGISYYYFFFHRRFRSYVCEQTKFVRMLSNKMITTKTFK